MVKVIDKEENSKKSNMPGMELIDEIYGGSNGINK